MSNPHPIGVAPGDALVFIGGPLDGISTVTGVNQWLRGDFPGLARIEITLSDGLVVESGHGYEDVVVRMANGERHRYSIIAGGWCYMGRILG